MKVYDIFFNLNIFYFRNLVIFKLINTDLQIVFKHIVLEITKNKKVIVLKNNMY